MKPLQAIAVVNKKSPKLNIYEIYPTKEKNNLVLGKDEKIVKVEISTVSKK